MNELKTLKDMDSKSYSVPESIDLFKDNLKAEAVKWVKYFEDRQKNNFLKVDYGKEIFFIKHFFNLTEDDLKISTAHLKEVVK